LEAQAERIVDAALRRSFLERVAVNRELKRLYEQDEGEPGTISVN
jgi:hypothetical protein